MTARCVLAVVIVVLGSLARPSGAEACGCGGTTSVATAFRGADLVFAGTVTRVEGAKPWTRVNADGSVSAGLGTEPPVTTFEIAHVFKGRAGRQVVIVGDRSDCDVPFKHAEAWLVYAQTREGRVVTEKCTRTRLRTEAEASQDLAYLEGLEQGRPQGIVYGDVLRRILGADGQPALRALFEPLQVIAAGEGRRLEITTDRWGPYQLVLPPGDFEIWVERAGRRVAPRQMVHVDQGSERRLVLAVEYED